MLDKDAIAARRNPLSKDLERIKKLEAKKHAEFQVTHAPDSIYALATGSRDDPKYFYVGVTNNAERRWKDHLDGMNNPHHMKYAYIYAREVGIENVFMVILDPISEFTEADWMEILTEQGHVLTNGTGGNSRREKKRLKNVGVTFSQGAKDRAKKANAGLKQRS